MNLDDFNIWNKEKKEIEKSNRIVFPKHKEVWYSSIGKNIGFESNGKGKDFRRPVLILARIGAVFLVASMTTKGKNNKFYYKLDNTNFNKDSFITLSQIKTIDKKRLITKIGKIKDEDFLKIKDRIKRLF